MFPSRQLSAPLFAATVLFSASLASCGPFSSESFSVEEIEDSLVADHNAGHYKVALTCDYPFSGDPQLVRGVREWLGSQTGVRQDSALAAPELFLKRFYEIHPLTGETYAKHAEGYIYSVEARRIDEEENYVSYVMTLQTSKTGAPGELTTHITGRTFLKPIGKTLTLSEMIGESNKRQVAQLVANGLMEYFDVDNVGALVPLLNQGMVSEQSEGVLELPRTEVWLDDGDVVFQYQEGEIAPSDKGCPAARVPFSKLAPFFTKGFRRIFESAKK